MDASKYFFCFGVKYFVPSLTVSGDIGGHAEGDHSPAEGDCGAAGAEDLVVNMVKAIYDGLYCDALQLAHSKGLFMTPLELQGGACFTCINLR